MTVKPWIRRTLIALAALLLIAGGAYYWLFVESHMPADAKYALDIPHVRELAQSIEGKRAQSVEVEQVALFKFPASAVVAGDGFGLRELPVYSYRLVFPSGSLLVDTALNAAQGGAQMAAFDANAYARMSDAMAKAETIVITHEHYDHIGGLMAHPDTHAVLGHTRLTAAQLANPERSAPGVFPPGALEGYRALEYKGALAIAPGVVLIKAPGHTPGSQMVYVQTATGAEFLFIGDVAWHHRNIDTQRERARLVTWLFLQEDRRAVFGQLAALKRLEDMHPEIHVVPGHDGGVIRKLLQTGALTAQFSPSP